MGTPAWPLPITSHAVAHLTAGYCSAAGVAPGSGFRHNGAPMRTSIGRGRSGSSVGLLCALLAMAPSGAAEEETTEQLYATRCQPCHGVKGKASKPEMNLADGHWIHGSSLADMVKVIEEGVPGKAMLGFKEHLSKEQIEALARLVQSFGKKGKAGKKAGGR